MFPNPQSALPLPPRPSIERYKKIAKDLVKACRSGDRAAMRSWSTKWVESLVDLSNVEITPQLPVNASDWIDAVDAFAGRKLRGGASGGRTCSLADAQFVIARSHGFESWSKFANHLEAMARYGSLTAGFEAAADAIVGGDLATVKRLLYEEPGLVLARSAREHGATLLHYVSANGVEGYRQKTPRNIVEIAEVLLRAGAEVDATASVYGAECTTLGLTATSVHPVRAGVQEALLRTLLDHGAEIDPPASAGGGQSMVAACLASGRLPAAELLAQRGARIDVADAAGLGNLDVLRSFFRDGGDTASRPTPKHLNEGFLFACRYGHTSVVEFLIENSADLAAHARDGQTGLHLAAMGVHSDTMYVLLKRNAPLEAENVYGGTVLGQTLWSAAHDPDPDRCIAVLDALVAAGARVPAQHAPISASLDEWLTRHGSKTEPAWRW